MRNVRSIRSVTARLFHQPVRNAPLANCVMQLTVDASAITALRHCGIAALRQMVMRLCGESMEFMRVAICPDTRKAKIWVCVPAAMAGAVMDMVLRGMPTAEFGHVLRNQIQ